MRKSLIVIMLAGGIGFSALASPALAGTYSLKAITRLRSGVTTAVSAQNATAIPDALVGDEYTVNILVSNYGSDIVYVGEFPVGTINQLGGIRSYQVHLDSRANALSGGNPEGLILTKGWDAPIDNQTCVTDADCDFAPGLHCETRNNFPKICVGATHNPGQGVVLSVSNPNWLHAGWDTSNGVSFQDLRQTKWFSAINGSFGTPDPGSGAEFYLGHVILVVKPFACGTYEIKFTQEQNGNSISEPSGLSPADLQLGMMTITVGTCPPVKMAADPPDCFIDPKRPHAPTTTTPREGIGSVLLMFDVATSGLAANQFQITQVGGGTPPGFTVQSQNTNNLLVNFLRQAQPTTLEVERWTCLRHAGTVQNPGTNLQNCWGVLPGDVNQDQVVNEDDFTVLTTILRGSTVPASDVPRCDLDRSGRCTPLDVLAEADMQGGAEQYPAYINHTLPGIDGCPAPPARP